LCEDVARPHPLHQQPADVPDHGGDPVALFERVGGPHGNRFLAETRVQPSDDLVLPEEIGHGVFDGAVEQHEAVEIELLLARHCRIGFRLHGPSNPSIPSSSALLRELRGSVVDFFLSLPAQALTGRGAGACSLSHASKCAANPSTGTCSSARPNTRPSPLASRCAASPKSTAWPSTCSTDAGRHPAIPHGTIRSK